MTNEEIIYEYYLNAQKKRREEAIELLNKREFKALHNNYIHWFSKKEKVVDLKSTLVSEAIKELATIKYEPNETEPQLECSIHEYNDESPFGRDTESKIVIVSYVYTISPYELCESLAKHWTRDALFKIKHQPNGKDTQRYLAIIDKKLNELKQK